MRDAQDAIVNPEDANYDSRFFLIDNRDCPCDPDYLHYSHEGINKISQCLSEELVIRAGRSEKWAEFSLSAFERAASSQHAGSDNTCLIL